jgi:AcrR family transcriptional regulator
MRYSAEHKEETRRKILDAAGRRFRAEGYDGLGIDGLAKEAGVTNGAFYGHFASKADAFREVVVEGLEELAEGIAGFRAKGGENWASDLATFYFSPAKLNQPENTCALPSFAPETARAPGPTREAFQAELIKVKDELVAGFDVTGKEADERAWLLLALLAGGVNLARAVPDPDLSDSIARVLRLAVEQVATGSQL